MVFPHVDSQTFSGKPISQLAQILHITKKKKNSREMLHVNRAALLLLKWS